MKTKNLTKKIKDAIEYPKQWTDLLNTPQLARVIADINTDGHIQLSGHRGLVSFYSKYLEDINKMRSDFKGLFSIEGRVYNDRRKNLRYKLFFISKELARFLEAQGAIVGNKTNIAYLTPSWIFNGDKGIKRAYLRGFFSSEGSISTWKEKGRERSRIYVSQCKSEELIDSGKKYMEQIRDMLNCFNIITNPIRFKKGNVRKDGSVSIEIVITIEQGSFANFYKEVGFDNKDKSDKLSKILGA